MRILIAEDSEDSASAGAFARAFPVADVRVNLPKLGQMRSIDAHYAGKTVDDERFGYTDIHSAPLGQDGRRLAPCAHGAVGQHRHCLVLFCRQADDVTHAGHACWRVPEAVGTSEPATELTNPARAPRPDRAILEHRVGSGNRCHDLDGFAGQVDRRDVIPADDMDAAQTSHWPSRTM